jgi:hypothetical protein
MVQPLSEFERRAGEGDIRHSRQSSGLRIGSMAGTVLLLGQFVFFNVVDIVWMSAYWKIMFSIFSSAGIGLAIGIWMHRMNVKADGAQKQKYHAEQARVKEREMVKFQATKAWPPK